MALIPLPGTVQQAPAGVSGCDVNQVLSSADAQSLLAANYAFCIRYIPRTSSLGQHDLTNAEAVDILNAGLALMAVQHVAESPWTPTAQLGTDYGSYAATYAVQVVGLPTGVNIWLDLEGISDSIPADDVIAYCQAWYTEVNNAGYVPGIYVGWGAVLSSSQLYNDLSFQHYWSAYNNDTPVSKRGFQLLQHDQVAVGNIEVDPNTTATDSLGGNALWLMSPAGGNA